MDVRRKATGDSKEGADRPFHAMPANCLADVRCVISGRELDRAVDIAKLVAQARILEGFPKIDPDFRIGEIEPRPDAVERLLCRGITGHKERKLLMPLPGPRDRLLDYVSDFRCCSFHRDTRFSNWLQNSSATPSM